VLLGELSNKWEIEIFKKNFPNIIQDDIKIVENAGNNKSYKLRSLGTCR
jgi:hypothetical protein